MKRNRRIKIIATLGPASNTEGMCAALFEAGVDVFRLNMSHLPREKLAEQVAMLRGLETRFRRPVGVLFVLGGLLAGVGGALSGIYLRAITPGTGEAFLIFAFIVLIAVLTLRPSGLLGERVADRA